MTPAEYDKALTALLHELLADMGFSKKRIRQLRRKTGDCEQDLTFYFIRERGLPGTLYTLSPTLSFGFPEVDRLTSRFLDEPYRNTWGTGVKPMYTVVPDCPVSRYRYCAEELLRDFAELVAADFRTYALSFYERYDTLDKLEAEFDRVLDHGGLCGFRVVRSGRHRDGFGCCIAAVLCLQKRWDTLWRFLTETEWLTQEDKERIEVCMSENLV